MVTFIVWVTILALGASAGLCGVQAVSAGGDKDYHCTRESLIAAAITSCAGLCAAGFAGVLPPMAVLILATAAALTAVGGLWYEQGTRNGETARLGAILGDVATAARMAPRKPRRAGGPGTGPVVIPGHAEPAAPGPAAGPRTVPQARMDPNLDQPPDTGGVPVIQGQVIPQFGPLLDMVASFEPGTDEELIRFLRGMAAGLVAMFEALQSAAENTGEAGAGVDASIIQALLEAAESVGDTAHDFELVRRRFLVVYGATLEAIQGGMRLPWKARTFLTGDAA